MLHTKQAPRPLRVFFIFFETIFFYRVIVMDQAWISSAVNSICSDYLFFFNLYCAFAYNILGLENSEY